MRPLGIHGVWGLSYLTRTLIECDIPLRKITVRELLIILSLSITVSSTLAWGQITLEVYESNGEMPFDFNDSIMVGTKLTIILISDSNSYWSGGLFITDQDRALGTLVGRGLDPNGPNARDYVDSHCESAGDFARVTAWKDSSIWGFDLYTFYPVDGNSDDNSTVPGEWFIIDYEADEVGGCNIGFYDYSVSWSDANYFLSFSHSPTRDLNSDGKVDLIDFAIFSLQWDTSGCDDPSWCHGADLNRDGIVDNDDLVLFIDYWLWPDSQTATESERSELNSGLEQPDMQGMQQTQQLQQENYPSQTAQDTDVDEIETTQETEVNETVRFLEDLWLHDDEIREHYSEAKWWELIEDIKNSSEQF
jgi:hypothetical protein